MNEIFIPAIFDNRNRCKVFDSELIKQGLVNVVWEILKPDLIVCVYAHVEHMIWKCECCGLEGDAEEKEDDLPSLKKLAGFDSIRR